MAKRLGHGVAIGERYMNHNSNHFQNERLFVAILIDTIRAPVGESIVRDRRKMNTICHPFYLLI